MTAFSRLAAFLWYFALAIILWGAFVRLSGSGDGCGEHWPLCHGQWLPSQNITDILQTWIEFLHRIKSGLFGLLVVVFYIGSFIHFPKGSAGRWMAFWVLFFTFGEALIGAVLVKMGWVDQDRSLGRILIGALHLANTFALLASLVGVYVLSRQSEWKWPEWKRAMPAAVSFIVLCVLGNWTSLSSQLYPVSSLVEGLVADFSSDSHWIVRLRAFHPLLAVVTVYLLLSWRWERPDFMRFCLVVVVSLIFGFLTWLSLAPLWMKITHLLLADLLWSYFVYLFFMDGAEGYSKKYVSKASSIS